MTVSTDPTHRTDDFLYYVQLIDPVPPEESARQQEFEAEWIRWFPAPEPSFKEMIQTVACELIFYRKKPIGFIACWVDQAKILGVRQYFIGGMSFGKEHEKQCIGHIEEVATAVSARAICVYVCANMLATPVLNAFKDHRYTHLRITQEGAQEPATRAVRECKAAEPASCKSALVGRHVQPEHARPKRSVLDIALAGFIQHEVAVIMQARKQLHAIFDQGQGYPEALAQAKSWLRRKTSFFQEAALSLLEILLSKSRAHPALMEAAQNWTLSEEASLKKGANFILHSLAQKK